MFKDIALFLVVFALFLFGFAFAFFILQVRARHAVAGASLSLSPRCDMRRVQIDGCLSYFDAVLTVLKISLGEWDWDAIYEGGPISITFFIAYVVIGTIMLLNLLIAVRRSVVGSLRNTRSTFVP